MKPVKVNGIEVPGNVHEAMVTVSNYAANLSAQQQAKGVIVEIMSNGKVDIISAANPSAPVELPDDLEQARADAEAKLDAAVASLEKAEAAAAKLPKNAKADKTAKAQQAIEAAMEALTTATADHAAVQQKIDVWAQTCTQG